MLKLQHLFSNRKFPRLQLFPFFAIILTKPQTAPHELLSGTPNNRDPPPPTSSLEEAANTQEEEKRVAAAAAAAADEQIL